MSSLGNANPREYRNLVKELEDLVSPKPNASAKIEPSQWFTHLNNVMKNSVNARQSPMFTEVSEKVNSNILPIFSETDYKISMSEI